MKTKDFNFFPIVLFCSLVPVMFKIISPTLVDNFISALLLFFIPSLIIYFIFYLILYLVLKIKVRYIPLFVSIVVTLALIILLRFDFSLIILLIPGVIIYVLFPLPKSLIIPLIIFSMVFWILPDTEKIDKESNPELIVFAIDALRPEIVDSLISQGELPNLQGLIETGAYGPFLSEKPMMSPILWTMIGSGYKREKIGLDGFFDVSTQIKVPRLWDMLQQNGWSVGIFRWLMTWPVKEVKGFEVPDFYARDNSSYPPGYGDINTLRDIIKSGSKDMLFQMIPAVWGVFKDGVRGSTLLRLCGKFLSQGTNIFDRKIFYRFSRLTELEMSADVFLNMIDKFSPGFAAFYDNGCDIMGHRMWKYHDPTGFKVTAEEHAKYGSLLTDMYRYSDAVIGRVLEEFTDEVDIVVASDHGMGASDVKDEYTYWINVDKLFQDLGISESFYSQSLNLFQFVYPVREQDKDIYHIELDEHLARFKFEDDSRIFTLKTSSAGDYYIKNNYFGKDTCKLYLDGNEVNMYDYIFHGFHLSGWHTLYGVILLNGKNIKNGYKIEDAELIDLTPTILHWQELPVGEDIDGRVLDDVFIEKSDVKYIPQYEYPDTTGVSYDAVIDDQTKDRLRALGYVK